MRWLSTYFYNLKKSASEPKFYLEVRDWSLLQCISFATLTVIISSSLLLSRYLLRDVNRWQEQLQSLTTNFIQKIPDNSELSYKDGKLETHGLNLPFHISDDNYGNLAVIVDSDTPSDQALLTIGSERLFIVNSSESLDYSEIWKENWQLDKKQLTQEFTLFVQNFSQIAIMLLILTYPFQMVWHLSTILIWLFLLTFFTQSLYWLLGTKLNYALVYKIGIIAMSVSHLVNSLAGLLSPNTQVSLSMPAYVGIMLLVLFEFRRRNVSANIKDKG